MTENLNKLSFFSHCLQFHTRQTCAKKARYYSQQNDRQRETFVVQNCGPAIIQPFLLPENCLAQVLAMQNPHSSSSLKLVRQLPASRSTLESTPVASRAHVRLKVVVPTDSLVCYLLREKLRFRLLNWLPFLD